MDDRAMERFQVTHARPVADTTERTLLDIVAAVRLVAAGAARRVVLAALPEPELVAAEALVHAQAAAVEFRVVSGGGGQPAAVIVGPRHHAAEPLRLPLASVETAPAS